MTSVSEIEECIKLEKQTEEYLNRIKNANSEDRRDLIEKIKANISNAKDYLMIIQMDALDTSYYDIYEKHNDKISKLEQQFQSLLNDNEKAEKHSLSASDLANIARKILETQKVCY